MCEDDISEFGHKLLHSSSGLPRNLSITKKLSVGGVRNRAPTHNVVFKYFFSKEFQATYAYNQL